MTFSALPKECFNFSILSSQRGLILIAPGYSLGSSESSNKGSMVAPSVGLRPEI